jgi:hypothetical protein
MRLWENIQQVEPKAKPPELPNLLKRISVDDLFEPWLLATLKKTWRKLRRPGVA